MAEIVPYNNQLLPQEQVEQLPYYQDLKKIRETFKGKKNFLGYIFPLDWCFTTTKIVKRVAGLEEIAGYYTALLSTGKRVRQVHAWNYDMRRGLYVDLTQDQLFPTLPGIVVLPKDTDVLTKNREKTKKQRELHLYSGISEPLVEELDVVINQ